MAKNEKLWRIRVRLYRQTAGANVLEADTHEGLDDMAPLDDREVHLSIPAVLEAVHNMIHSYHDQHPNTIEGARILDLTKRIPTIRVYLSNHGGRTVLQVPYTPDGATAWRGFVTIQREGWTDAEAKPENPSARIVS